MPTNEELMATAKSEAVRKAIIATDDIATAGKLNPEQAKRFIDYIFDLSMMKDNARTVRFSPETLEINKIGVGDRVAMPASEATDPKYRRGVTTSKVTLTPREIIIPFEITDNILEINLEGEKLAEHIVKMMAKQTMNNLEELYLNGDTTGAAILESDYLPGGSATQYVRDNYMRLFVGWLRLADAGNVYDAAGASVGNTVFSRMINSLPVKWRRSLRDLRFFSSVNLEQLYREKTSTRATEQGDRSGQSDLKLTPFGIPIVPAPLFPEFPKVVEHITLNAAGGAAISLRYAPVVAASMVVTDQTLDTTPVTPYVEGVDWQMSTYATGQIEAVGGGALAAGGLVKVTYQCNPQMLLTHMNNFIVGIGRDIRIEKDRDIFKRVNQYAITIKAAVELEEADAVVKGINISSTV